MEDVKNGSLIKLKISGTAKTIEGKVVSLLKNDVGLIVAMNVWPGANWNERGDFQASAPYIKILFKEDIVLMPHVNLSTKYFEININK